MKDTGALFLTKVGHVALNGTDNIIISAVVGVLWVGRLSNYTLICDSVTSVLCQITAAITGSLGNFLRRKINMRAMHYSRKLNS